ncbi:MAG TPA: ribosome recycling factor [Sedimentisphaerales bacterium]|jgi:ribosome recycling factor|nr:ribosome recycling factor [Sedimentisphaerales bacterium]HNU29764.1 ribosome recycling factor [Sedimentisphaerales bacterium]
MATQAVVTESKTKMQKAVGVLQDDLKAFRGGRATPALVEHIKVEYYGNPTPLKSLATISAPEADMLVIKPFDPASLKDIEKAIKSSDLSIAPILEGKFIRLNIPPLSEERRKHLVQQAKQAGEQTKISLRNIRRDANKSLEKQEKDKQITEDDLKTAQKQIDDITKEFSDKVDSLVTHKSDEIMKD